MTDILALEVTSLYPQLTIELKKGRNSRPFNLNGTNSDHNGPFNVIVPSESLILSTHFQIRKKTFGHLQKQEKRFSHFQMQHLRLLHPE